jgi:hypothetical protein
MVCSIVRSIDSIQFNSIQFNSIQFIIGLIHRLALVFAPISWCLS